MATTYVGERTEKLVHVLVEEEGGRKHTLGRKRRPDRQFAGEHEWGYGGAGPGQLAWDILRDAIRDETAASFYFHEFRRDVVSRLPREGFRLPREDVKRWYEEQVAAEDHPAPEELDQAQAPPEVAPEDLRRTDAWDPENGGEA